MFKKTYEHLKYSGLDVYSIGQHKGLCEKPYIVIKENGLSEISGTSLTNDIIELLVYYPVGSYINAILLGSDDDLKLNLVNACNL